MLASDVQTIPYILNLPEGRTVVLKIPEYMTERDKDGTLLFKPEGFKLIQHVRALSMKTPAHPTAGYIRTVREALGLTLAEFAQRLHRSEIAVKKWEAGKLKPGEDARKRIQKLVDAEGRRGVIITD
jgi:DNA-binding transcriptional regulator YiaG